MNIEVLLTDQVNESIDSYDENRILFEANKFEAKKNQMFYMSNYNSTDETAVLIVGTDGCKSEYDFVDLGASIGKKINNDCDLKLTAISENLDMYLIELGIMLSTYQFENFKSTKSPEININVLNSEFSKEIENKVNSIFWVRDMVNFPALTKSPEFFQTKVEELIDGLNISFKSYDEEWIKENDMGGVIGVSQGSERSPKFLVGEYNPKAKKQISLIGKGVLFDSGGLSLKSPDGMQTMKTDMAGAATAWGIIALVAKQGLVTQSSLNDFADMYMCLVSGSNRI